MLSNNPKSQSPLVGIIYSFLILLCAISFVAACTNETTEPEDLYAGASGIPVAGTGTFEDPMGVSGAGVLDTAGTQIAAAGMGGTIPNNTAGIGGSVPPTAGSAGGTLSGGVGGTVVTGGVGGTVVTGGVGGTVDTGGVGGTDVTPVDLIIPDRCNGDDSKVAMIGDSYLALSGDITRFLREYTGLGLRRTFYISGTSFNTGIGKIPDQAETAYAQGPVQTFIMDGGGNDALLNMNCTLGLSNPACQRDVDAALAAIIPFLERAADQGVQEIIWFYYPHIISNAAVNNATDDYAIPIATENCESFTRLDCKMIDTVPAFEGHPEYITIDGIHPSRAGSEVIAKMILEVMEANCTNGLSFTQ